MQHLYFAPLCLITIYFLNYHSASLFYQNVVTLAMTYLLESKNEVYSIKPINLIRKLNI